MSKKYGPKGFDKALEKALVNFNETKLFITHTRYNTVVKYIDGDKLYGIEMYRHSWDIERWLPHFQHYLDTGIFDTNAYWCQYTHEDGKSGERDKIYLTEPVGLPMVLKGKIWSVHSPEMNDYMNSERSATKRDIGFEQVARPEGV